MAAALMGSRNDAEALLPQLQQELDNMEEQEDDMSDDVSSRGILSLLRGCWAPLVGSR